MQKCIFVTNYAKKNTFKKHYYHYYYYYYHYPQLCLRPLIAPGYLEGG